MVNEYSLDYKDKEKILINLMIPENKEVQ